MLKRKINKVGQNTLTVSLPAKWARDLELQSGDELGLQIEGKSIIFSPSLEEKKPRKIQLSIDKMNKYLLSRYLVYLYVNGYDEITLYYTKTEISDDKNESVINVKSSVREYLSRFIGFEIVSQTQNKMELRCFLPKEKQDLHMIEQQVQFLFKETCDEIITAMKLEYKKFHESIIGHCQNIQKFIHYFLRMLGTADKPEEEKSQLYALYIVLDKLQDKIRHISEMIIIHNYTTRLKKQLEEFFHYFSDLFRIINLSEIKIDYITKRYQLVKKFRETKYTLDEFHVIVEARMFLDIFNDFTRLMIYRTVQSEQIEK